MFGDHNEFLWILFIAFIFFTASKTFFTGFSVPVGPLPRTGMPLQTSPYPTSHTLQQNSLLIGTPSPSFAPTPTLTSIPLTSCSIPSPINTNLPALISTITQKYGIRLSGNALTLDKARITYATMCVAFQSLAYQKNLNSLQHPIDVSYVYKGNCFAWTFANPERTELWEPCSDLIDMYILIHELTHDMQFGTSHGRNAHVNEWQKQVWSSEKTHRIPTGPCVYEDPGDGGECEADAIAEYIFYSVYRNRWTSGPPGAYNLPNYPTSWPKWYNFAKDKIFGGTVFTQVP